MSDKSSDPTLLGLTAQIIAAHVSNNSVEAEALPALIRSVHAALAGAGTVAEVPTRPEPAVPAKRSIFPDYIICLEDGKKLKTLKRHLASAFQMTPDEYRARWDLPKEYPMVAPNYAKQRSALAKQLGLGRKPAEPEPAPEPAKPRGRKPRAAA